MHLRAEHYNQCIKNQSNDTLTMHILRLQKEQRRLIREIENKEFGKPRPLNENDEADIARYRWYIQDSLSVLDKRGKELVLDERERAALQFQKDISSISRLVFYIGGYLGGHEKYEITIEADNAYISYSLSDTLSIPPLILIEPDSIKKEEFLEFIRSLHMGEWQQDYTTGPNEYMMYNSIFWDVIVYYDNSEKREFGGLNAFPYNFSRFQGFFESHKMRIDRI